MLSGILAGFLAATPAALSAQQPTSQIIPRPRLEKLTGDAVTLAGAGGDITVSYVSGEPKPAALTEGLGLLAARFKSLGGSLRDAKADATRAMIVFEKCPMETMARTLSARGVKEVLDPKRLAQAYQLSVSASGKGQVTLRAAGDLGLYYGVVSLVQLVEADSKGKLQVPAGEILDWPEIAHRLAKTSATDNAPAIVNRFAAWMPFYKISQVGLQFHGVESLELDTNFTTSIKAICGWARRTAICETVVYFCPFRGKPKNVGAYDFRLPEHRAAYVQLLEGFLAQGAHGIEVDYNDWGDNPEIPIEDVLNLACESVWKKDPAAYVFWCAPNLGTATYNGPATPELARILSKVPDRVWPLWVGSPENWNGFRGAIPRRLEAEDWTRTTGRRPFLWLNRVSFGVTNEMGRALAEAQGAHAFRGEVMPKDLNRLIAGVHFNAGMSKGYMKLPNEFSPEALAYFATAADYVWNPHDWEAVESCRRARRFMSIMSPLLAQRVALVAAEN